jgi:uncharacterized protein YjbI with pentapeptide repeats
MNQPSAPSLLEFDTHKLERCSCDVDGRKHMATRVRRRVAGERGRGPASATRWGDTPHSPWPIRAAVIAAVATLLASLGGLYFSGQAARQATAAQASERFSRSVEQLGSDSIAVRIGAVYSFARLMRDSQADQQAIVEILSSFIRIRADREPPPASGEETRPVPADMLAALRVLDEQPRPLALTVGAGPRAERAMLLERVDLTGFDLSTVAIRQAALFAADLTGANLRSADLTGAWLFGATLEDADLSNANLTGAALDNANLEDAELAYADLADAGLAGANLTGADLSNTDLTTGALNRATLTRVDLTDANLTGASLDGAQLAGADLADANLTDAYLTGANLTDANLTGITCSPDTRWPQGLSPLPACGGGY